jgi:hypothetical protein
MLIPMPILASSHMVQPSAPSPQKRIADVPIETTIEKADDEPKRMHSSETTVIDGVVKYMTNSIFRHIRFTIVEVMKSVGI